MQQGKSRKIRACLCIFESVLLASFQLLYITLLVTCTTVTGMVHKDRIRGGSYPARFPQGTISPGGHKNIEECSLSRMGSGIPRPRHLSGLPALCEPESNTSI